MRPTVGRTVHYTNLGDKDGKYPPQVIAAIITKVDRIEPGVLVPSPEELAADAAGGGAVWNYDRAESSYVVSLKCLYPTGLFDLPSAPYTHEVAGSDAARGKWTWPERA